MAKKLFFAQILAHLSVIPMIVYAQPRHYVWALGIYFLTGCLGMSMTYHRLVTHQSWTAPHWFEILGLTFASLGLTGSCVAWCAAHRMHHQFADKPQDPHSPHQQGYFKAQFLSMFSPIRLSALKSFTKNPTYSFFHRHYWHIQFVYVLFLLMMDPFAVVYLYLFPACLLWNAGSLINTVGHRFGSQPFHTADESRNNVFLGILMWGEGWHNNHHRFPKSSQFGRTFWQLDISGLLIRLLEVKR
ncbi:MAG: acyl-CoA desaturase [Bdellovibrio sp.]|nr:acyl-CoA desaturase [Bdellovibrio sp.]